MKPNIDLVLFDLDGVLAYFHKAGLKLFDRDESAIYPGCGWIPDIVGCTEEEFWGKVDENFWLDMEKMPDANDLFSAVKNKISKGQIGFLTSPARLPRNWSGKAAWVRKHYPYYIRRLVITSDKSICARPTTLLIDDTVRQVEEFKKAGGQAILVPRPWNNECVMAENTIEIVKGRLDDFTYVSKPEVTENLDKPVKA